MTSTYVQDLAGKAARADKSEDAMRFSQAAVNVSNSLINLTVIDEHASRLSKAEPPKS